MNSLEAYTQSPRTLLGSSPELRLEIFQWVFLSTTLYSERVPITAESPRTLVGSFNKDGGNTYVEQNAKRRLSFAPSMPEQLNPVCRMFDDEIGDSWHSMGTYYFPNTVAFIDVLSSGPKKRIDD